MLRRCSLFDISGSREAVRCISAREMRSRRTSPVYGGGGPRIARWRGVHLALNEVWQGKQWRKVLPSSVCFAATFSRRREKGTD